MAELDSGLPHTSGFWQRHWLTIIVAAIAAVLVGWLYVSKIVSVRAVEKAAAAQSTELRQQAIAQQTAMSKQWLGLFAMPLAWAVRRELMTDNLDQVDQYVTELVKQKGFERVVLANPDGMIVVATDRKQLGVSFASLYPERYLGVKQITVDETAPGKWLLVVPIMGLNARLGTLAIDYQAAASALSG